jgi:formylglycine-generating enzyme required for sulfatase activity
MGSTHAECRACVDLWTPRLQEDRFRSEFASWIEKELPAHDVSVPPFRMSRYPCTNAEYARFVDDTGARVPESLQSAEPAEHPAWGVDAAEADAYAAWLSRRLGIPLCLPSEAQWEYAARGASRREFPFGDRFDAALCNTVEAGIGRTTPVDHYPVPSAFGIFDLAGNVEEWTASRYAPYPGGRFVADDVQRHNPRGYRVLRGGAFTRAGDLARCARRHGPVAGPDYRYRGFRLVQPLT